MMSDIGSIALTKKKCKPCEVGAPPLDPGAIETYLKNITGWQVEENKKIKKEFHFEDFVGAMGFVNKVARIAEAEGHHPSIFISYNKVRITLSTHAVGGLSENDFILAAKIDQIS